MKAFSITRLAYLTALLFASGACAQMPGPRWTNSVPDVVDAVRVADPADVSTLKKLPQSDLVDALSIFAGSDDVKSLEKCLAAGADVNAENSRGGNALVSAIGTNSLNAAAVLLEAGASSDFETRLGTPANLAEAVGSVEMRRIVLKGAEFGIDARLRVAARDGRIDHIRSLLSSGANINSKDEEGFTALLEATQANQLETIKELLKGGAAAETLSSDGLTPLALAVINSNKDIADALLRAGADSNRKILGVPLLSFAVIGGSNEILDLLLEYGADPKIKSDDQALPAALAKMIGNDDVARRLGGVPELEQRIDLLTAIRASDLEGVEIALEQGGDPNTRTEEGYPAVLVAAAQSEPAIVALLLRSGASSSATGPQGETLVLAALANPDRAKGLRNLSSLLATLNSEEVEDLLAKKDAKGRNGFFALAATNIGSRSELVRQLRSFVRSRLGENTASLSSLSRLVNTPDADGISPLEAAVLARNAILIGMLSEGGVEETVDLGRPSLQDVARAKGFWDVLAALPSDRDIDFPLMKGAAIEAFQKMQTKLQEWGYYQGTIDGKFGDRSRSAMISFLKDREKELIALGDSSKFSSRKNDAAKNGEYTLVVESKPNPGSCTWKVAHWQVEKGSDKSSKFVGCVRPGASHWNADGFGYVEYGDGTNDLLLFGADGWDDNQRL
jgi:ankyrin repeat protein